MAGLAWFRCYPRDFNDGMVGLTLEERGAYVTLLNAIYARGEPIPDDASWLRAMLCVGPKAWVKLRASLIVKGKIYALTIDAEPHLMNTRAAKELEKTGKLSENFREAAIRRWENTRPVSKENNGLTDAEAVGRQWVGNANQSTEPDTEPPIEPKGSISPPKKAARGTRLADDWEPSELEFQMALNEGLTAQETEHAAREFRNYWCSRTRDAARIKWGLVWQNRVATLGGQKRERDARMAPQARTGGNGSAPVGFADIVARRRGWP